MADVFLSYKRADKARAKEIADAIEKHGYSVFFDAEIDVGEPWNARIEREINDARCVAVLWSAESADTMAGEWVHNEARKGKARKVLAPALIGACEIPLEFSAVQAADLRAWRGDPSEAEWRRFIDRIGDCVARKPTALRATPWRRRWVRVMMGVVLGAAVTGGILYLSIARPWEPEAVREARLRPTPPPAPAPTAPAVELPGSVERMLQSSITAGDCEGLRADMELLRAQLPTISLFERSYMSECQRRATQIASVAPAAATAPAAGSSTPAPSAAAKAVPTTPAGDNFLASLRARDAASLTPAQFASAAAPLGVEGAALQAVAHAESETSGFNPDGRPRIFFEPHIFSRQTNRRFDATNPEVSYPRWDRARYPRDQEGHWENLRRAYALDPDAALRATAWGRFGILGMNFAAMGFPDVRAFVRDVSRSEADQLAAMIAFCRANGLIDEIQRKDWAGFARGYNGPGAVDIYSRRLIAAYAEAQQTP